MQPVRKFNAIEYEMMSTMSALRNVNEDIKMDLIKSNVRKKSFYLPCYFRGLCVVLKCVSNVYGLGKICSCKDASFCTFVRMRL